MADGVERAREALRSRAVRMAKMQQFVQTRKPRSWRTAMSDILERIVAVKHEEIAAARAARRDLAARAGRDAEALGGRAGLRLAALRAKVAAGPRRV